MRILGIERDKLACNYYRVLLPLGKMAEQNLAEVDFIEDGPDLCTDEALAKVLTSDVILFHRPASVEWFEFIKVCQVNGKTIIADYDDDPFNTSPWNPYYKYVGVEEFYYEWPDGRKQYLWKDGVDDFDIEANIVRRDMFWACFKKADMVSTTTPILQGFLGKINKNTQVLPNLVDFDFFPKCEFVKKEIRIGWQGGSSHYEDLYMIKDDLIKLLNKHKNVKFVYLGDVRFKGLFKDVNPDQIEWHFWTPHIVYPYKMATVNLDIGLCPIVDNVFNRNKSAIKWMEYSVLGASTIASDIPPYSEVMNEQTGILCGKDGWFEAMDSLVRDKEKRNKLAKNAYDDVYENHNINKKAHLWANAYDKVLKQEVTL